MNATAPVLPFLSFHLFSSSLGSLLCLFPSTAVSPHAAFTCHGNRCFNLSVERTDTARGQIESVKFTSVTSASGIKGHNYFYGCTYEYIRVHLYT